MTATPVVRPSDGTRDRIRRLRDLIARATTELETLTGSTHRVRTATNRLGGPYRPPTVDPSKAPARIVRAWARDQGIPVAVRGDVSADVRIAYATAHPEDPTR